MSCSLASVRRIAADVAEPLRRIGETLVRVPARKMSAACSHPLCALIGGTCSLATNRSRGCRPGRWEKTTAAAVFDEVRALLPAIEADARSAVGLAAAVRLAQLVRAEAREERNLLAQAREDEPELADALARLVVRRS